MFRRTTNCIWPRTILKAEATSILFLLEEIIKMNKNPYSNPIFLWVYNLILVFTSIILNNIDYVLASVIAYIITTICMIVYMIEKEDDENIQKKR